MPKEGYYAITLPDDVIEEIRLIQKTNESVYRNQVDVVKTAIGLLKKKILKKS